jgi:serine/threonine-protein kinase
VSDPLPRAFEPDLGRVGRYRLVDRIAVTAMSEVFRAEVTDDDGVIRRVALKRVRDDLATSDEMNRMFLDEAAIARSLEHGNVVRTLDFGLDGHAAYLVMELVDGWDLGRVLARGGPPPIGVALYVAREMLEGLAHIHGRKDADGSPMGLVHRDISVENVLLTRDGEAKIADFGIAKARTNRALTGPGIMKGKVGSMSPEQVLGRALDPRSDVFSVGVVLYRMLAGHAPFEAPTDGEVLVLTTKGEFAPLPESVPEPVRALVASALAAEPSGRPESAGAMAQRVEEIGAELGLRMTAGALRKLLEERMQGAGAAKLDAVLRRAARGRAEASETLPSVRRRRWAIGGIGVGAVVAALLFASAFWPREREPVPRTRTTTSTGTSTPAPSPSSPPTSSSPSPSSSSSSSSTPSTTAPARSTAPAGFAMLQVNVVPWAKVTLDGAVVDDETPMPPLRIAAGRHVLVLENPTLNLRKQIPFRVAVGGTYRVSQW